MTADVAVVGSGAAGALVCLHLARAAPELRTALIGPGPAGVGVAYSTLAPEHLLNVPVARMSARSDEPDEFLAWLRARGYGVSGGDFVPRALFGAYVQDLLAASRAPSLRIEAQAVRLWRQAGGLWVELEGGGAVGGAAVVLALGMLSPRLPPLLRGIARRAWDAGALDGLAPADELLLLGSGLTMVDVALTLSRRGHRGTMHVLSRHGLLPAPHRPGIQPAPFRPRESRLRELVRAVRAEVNRVEAAGGDWRAVVDALRPETPAIWASLSLADRGRFVRHLRAYWDVHRHRMAPEAARELGDLLESGRLRVHAGWPEHASVLERAVTVRWRERGSEIRRELIVSRVLDCATVAGVTHADSPLLRSAEAADLVRLDPLGLGIETGPFGAAVVRGQPSSSLFAVGALRRFERWESTAIPELRDQAAELAGHLRYALMPSNRMVER